MLFFRHIHTQKYGAPWVPTPYKIIEKMLTLAEVKPEDVVYDLGSGDGRVIIEAARSFGAKAVGIEIDPLRFMWTKARIYFLSVLRDSFHNFEISFF